MKQIIFTLCCIVWLMACSSKKTTSQNQADGGLYRKWQLVHIEKTASEETMQSPVDYKSKKLFATFSKEGRMNFNLDANTCAGTFKEEANQTLVFNNTDFVCTKMCCDTIRLNYHEVKRYEVQKNTLKLFSDKEIFYFELVK